MTDKNGGDDSARREEGVNRFMKTAVRAAVMLFVLVTFVALNWRN